MYNTIAAYQFVKLENLQALREQLYARCEALNLKGTILLAEEGINVSLAGLPKNIEDIQLFLRGFPLFKNLEFKQSPSKKIPFRRLFVKLKSEIITLGRPRFDTKPFDQTHLAPKTLKQWLDEKRDVVLLDTRNDYETQHGLFENAIDLNIQQFTDFPEEVALLDPALKEKTVVMYCTGGVRCEKAIAVLQEQGFSDIYQLDGGILNYFKECGGAHYQGNCFVYDERIALTPELEEVEMQEHFKQEAQASWTAYQETGKHLSSQETRRWLNTWGSDEEAGIPPCHE